MDREKVITVAIVATATPFMCSLVSESIQLSTNWGNCMAKLVLQENFDFDIPLISNASANWEKVF
jgi:hypothetical protein